MPTPDPGTGRGATVHAVLYFLASTPFLVLLALGLHISGILTLDRVTDLLHGKKAEPVANATPAPQFDPPPPPTMQRPPGVNPTPVPPVVVGPPPNQPPRVTAEPRVVFGKGDRTKQLEVRVDDETPATGLRVEVRSQDEGLVPAAGLRRDGAGPTSVLTVTPAPGKWGDAVVRVTATDPAGLSGEAVIRVTVPAPEFALAELPNVTVKRGEPLPPVALRVVDESPTPGKVTFTALASGAVLKADGLKVGDGRMTLTPVPNAVGVATVTVIAATADGREDRKTFTVTVSRPPPPPLAVGVKARVTPAVGSDVVYSSADARGTGNLGVPALDRGTEVQVTAVGGNRIQVSWRVGNDSYTGWLTPADVTTFE